MKIVEVGEIQDLIQRAHTIALEKGWWAEKVRDDRDYNEVDALIHSELAEATEAFREGKMEMYFLPSGKPEGFVVELGDAAIRAADCLGRHGWKSESDKECIDATYEAAEETSFKLPLQLINRLHIHVGKISGYGDRKDNDSRGRFLEAFILGCYGAAYSLKLDIRAAIEAKLAYNATRPNRHGGKLA